MVATQHPRKFEEDGYRMDRLQANAKPLIVLRAEGRLSKLKIRGLVRGMRLILNRFT